MTATRLDPPPAHIRDYLDYDAGTGAFRWIKRFGNSKVHPGDIAGCLTPDGYRVLMFDGRNYKQHRLAWWFVHGEWPPVETDHIDLDGANNRIANLRPATTAQNQMNRSAGEKLKGASRNRRTGRWEASIKHRGQRIYIGTFATEDEAARAYDAEARNLFGAFARPNFIGA